MRVTEKQVSDKMELTPLDRLLYEVDRLGLAKTYVVTQEQLEDLVKACEPEKDGSAYEDGWNDGFEEARERAMDAVRYMD